MADSACLPPALARRALAVDAERAIAENELSNQIALFGHRAGLIARSEKNARATAEAARIRLVETASVEAERDRMPNT